MQIEDCRSGISDSHYNDKKAVRPSYICNENSHSDTTMPLDWNGLMYL